MLRVEPACSPQHVVFPHGLARGHPQRAFLVRVVILLRTYGREPLKSPSSAAAAGDSDDHNDDLLSFSPIFAFL